MNIVSGLTQVPKRNSWISSLVLTWLQITSIFIFFNSKQTRLANILLKLLYSIHIYQQEKIIVNVSVDLWIIWSCRYWISKDLRQVDYLEQFMEQNLFRYIQHSLQKYKVDKQHCKATISQHQITNFLFWKAYQVRKFLCKILF